MFKSQSPIVKVLTYFKIQNWNNNVYTSLTIISCEHHAWLPEIKMHNTQTNAHAHIYTYTRMYAMHIATHINRHAFTLKQATLKGGYYYGGYTGIIKSLYQEY